MSLNRIFGYHQDMVPPFGSNHENPWYGECEERPTASEIKYNARSEAAPRFVLAKRWRDTRQDYQEEETEPIGNRNGNWGTEKTQRRIIDTKDVEH